MPVQPSKPLLSLTGTAPQSPGQRLLMSPPPAVMLRGGQPRSLRTSLSRSRFLYHKNDKSPSQPPSAPSDMTLNIRIQTEKRIPGSERRGERIDPALGLAAAGAVVLIKAGPTGQQSHAKVTHLTNSTAPVASAAGCTRAAICWPSLAPSTGLASRATSVPTCSGTTPAPLPTWTGWQRHVSPRCGTRYIPEADSGHSLILARAAAAQRQYNPSPGRPD